MEARAAQRQALETNDSLEEAQRRVADLEERCAAEELPEPGNMSRDRARRLIACAWPQVSRRAP